MFADKEFLTMSETMLVAVAGIAVVLLSKIFKAIESRFTSSDEEVTVIESAPAAPPAAAPAAAPAVSYGTANGIQLIDVDEPTAAVVMALVSNQSGIPLERLAFRSIKGITELVDVDERTAATIMAIVSNESGIPLNRLNFKSIKKVEE